MNYYKTIEKALKYIRKNIEDPISLDDIASTVGYSQYHFSRIFSDTLGVSPMEYVRSEKLNFAAKELFKGNKIIDIAFKYGYETPSGFSKAFRKEFGYTPTKYVSHMALLSTKNIYKDDGRFNMDFRIVEKEGFNVVGYGIETNINKENFTKEVAAFWSQYDINGWEEKLYKRLNPPKHGEVGISISEESGNLKYVLGVVVEDTDSKDEDMIKVEVPSAKYAVFTTAPVDYAKARGIAGEDDFAKAIKDAWKYIFEEWFRTSGCEYDEDKMDFEFYDERCHFKPDTVMEIYVPIKEKK